jgi:hypothetical protein
VHVFGEDQLKVMTGESRRVRSARSTRERILAGAALDELCFPVADGAFPPDHLDALERHQSGVGGAVGGLHVARLVVRDVRYRATGELGTGA